MFLRRGRSGAERGFVNEDAVAEFLESIGFRIVDPESLTVDELVDQTLGAQYVIGCEGSHMSHSILTIALSGTMICLI
ncbi:hypothetical protein SCG7086_DF_00050, partial [Chlamydiales bacterium SCGC AG-110-P3]